MFVFHKRRMVLFQADGATDGGQSPPADAPPNIPSEPDKPIDPPEETLEQLRSKVALLEREKTDVTRESMARKAKLQELEKAKQATEDAGKTELQKAQDDLKAAQDELTGTRAVARRHTLLSEVRKVGSKLNVTFNESALADLYGAGHFDKIEANAEGAFDELEGFMKGLIKERSYILQNQTQSPDIHSQSKGKGALDEYAQTRKEAEERNKAKAEVPNWKTRYGYGAPKQ